MKNFLQILNIRNLPVRGKPVLKMLWFVVLCGKGSFVQGMFSRVGLRCGLDIHERHRRGGTPCAAWGTTAAPATTTVARIGTGTTLVTFSEGTTGTSIHGAFLAPRQQLDALHASISVNIPYSMEFILRFMLKNSNNNLKNLVNFRKMFTHENYWY